MAGFIFEDAYLNLINSLAVATGVVGISYAGKKTVKVGLGVDTSLKEIAKLTAGIFLSSMTIRELKLRKMIPENPFENPSLKTKSNS